VWDIYARYDVSSELMMLGVAVLMMLVIYVMQPRRSNMFRMVVMGFGFGIVAICLHQLMLYTSCHPEAFSRGWIYTIYILYSFLYSSLLILIFAYISLLSYRERARINVLHYKTWVLMALYMGMMLLPVFLGKLYIIDENGVMRFTDWQYLANQAGVLDAVLSLIVMLKNKKSLSKIVRWGIWVFTPVEIAILAIESIFKTAYFISYTYVLPFLIFFILFHCLKYDEVVGCQNSEALDAQIQKAIKNKKDYIILNCTFPQLQKREFEDIRNSINYVSSEKCREIEDLKPGIRLYSSSIFNYYLFALTKNQEEADRIVEGVRRILLKPMKFGNTEYRVYSKQIVVGSHSSIKSSKHANSMFGYLRTRFSGNRVDERIIAGPEDYTSFETYYEVEQALLDIRAKNDLDDERVVCFIQPIHNISTQSFRTGESLMRMNLNGKMIYPDKFISVAENNDCIHTLTRIMLNKVCRKIQELEKQNFDFDAITVNCATLEFEDWNMYKEVLEIIEANKIDPSHLKLEITESTSTTNYDSILHNMKMLNEKGITFYLDDFGTGYSNLERIINFPFKTINFDKSILYNALESTKADEMIRMMVKYFGANGLKTLVEGVENQEQYEYCKSVGFDYIQGYLFSKPQPAENITNYFENK